MLELLSNCYRVGKKKSGRKITLALLGLDNAGKTTILNTLKGDIHEDATPTFGFNSSTIQEGKHKVLLYDLGGGKNIRGVWKNYLAEVHGIVYVVDAADPTRFEEAKETMMGVLDNQYIRGKPVLVYANKQDLPTAASAAEVVKSLGLTTCKNSHNVCACAAKTPMDQAVDARLREGLKWLVGSIDREYDELDPRVQAEAEAVRQEDARKRKEREIRVLAQREERLRREKEEEEQQRAAREVEKENVLHDCKAPSLLAAMALPAPPLPAEYVLLLAQEQEDIAAQLQLHHGMALGLPHTIESPGKLPPPRRPLEPPPASDLRPPVPDQGAGQAQGSSTGGSGTSTLPPIRGYPSGAQLSGGGAAAVKPLQPVPSRDHGEGAGTATDPGSSAAAGQGGARLAGSRPVSAGGSWVDGGSAAGRTGAGGGTRQGSGSSGSPPQEPQAEPAGGGGGSEGAGHASGDGADEQGQRGRGRPSSGGSAGQPAEAAPKGGFGLVPLNNRVVPLDGAASPNAAE